VLDNSPRAIDKAEAGRSGTAMPDETVMLGALVFSQGGIGRLSIGVG
jgi:hypothetical protein